MIFELISWIYISLICLIWGNWVLKLFLGVDAVTAIDFPIICFIGISVIGIISFYLSLIIPLFNIVKLALQVPAFLMLLNAGIRKQIFFQLNNPFVNFSILNYGFLIAILLMILFLCTSPVIHPDTLNYHAFSTQIFDKYGTIPGIANLKPEFGFQSLWFAVMAFFDFSFFGAGPRFPLNGCVMAWVAVFLVSKGTCRRNIIFNSNQLLKGTWYLVLILFSILSWTQIRLTASSLSPDFIATISILMSFYFFVGKDQKLVTEKSDLLVAFFSVIAVSIKLSSIPVLLIPLLVFGYGLIKRRFFLASRVCLLVIILLIPVVIRNVISTGYPFYPSSFASIYPSDWKVNESEVLVFQRYITTYARFPILRVNTLNEYNKAFSTWLPLWWDHLYLIDKALIVFILLGVLWNLFFFRTFISIHSKKTIAAFLIAVAGSAFWFMNAPDPRFGTGFLLPLIYFLYYPFIKYLWLTDENYLSGAYNGIIKIASVFIIVYIGYRAVYYFNPAQLVFPEGISNISSEKIDCDASVKKMILDNSGPSGHLTDSCIFFRLRGTTIKQGFAPLR